MDVLFGEPFRHAATVGGLFSHNEKQLFVSAISLYLFKMQVLPFKETAAAALNACVFKNVLAKNEKSSAAAQHTVLIMIKN